MGSWALRSHMGSAEGASCVCDSPAACLHRMRLGCELGQFGKVFGKGDRCFCTSHESILRVFSPVRSSQGIKCLLESHGALKA